MRLVAALVLLGCLTATPVRAEPLPSGALGLVFGAFSGTGADARRLGYGYLAPWPPSFHAAWHTGKNPKHPMDTEDRFGWAVRWTTIFHETFEASAAQVDGLRTMQMDIMLGVRVRPGSARGRFITLRGGPAMFRANQGIPPRMHRAFIGGVGSVGVQQYLFGVLLLDVDVRYGLIATGPSELVLTIGASLAGP